MRDLVLDLRFKTRHASQEEVDAALDSLEQHAGIYLGVDAGIAGLHPLQASLLVEPALAFHLHGDGIEVQALTQWGNALLNIPQLALWQTASARGAGQSVQASLRAFLSCFAASPDLMLIGALPFDAHLLNSPCDHAAPLGLLYLGQHLLRRDSAGQWHRMDGVLDELSGVFQGSDFHHEDQVTSAQQAAQAKQTAHEGTSEVPQDDSPPGGYADMVRRALVRLKDSALVSLTLSQTYRRRVSMKSTEAFARLRKANPAPACFFIHNGKGLHVLGASPDLQLMVQGRRVVSLPVCGTVLKRDSPVGEALSLKELINEDVDAASLAVCTDALRNDLAPLCVPGSLKLTDRRKPMMLATVVHTVDRLEGQLLGTCDAWDAIFATAAPVMVTGTPRAPALAAIAEFERSPRGWYGGLVVQVASNGNALAGTLLRAAIVERGIAQVRTGGDLMADSSPEREEQESSLKALSLWRAFGLEAAPTNKKLSNKIIILPDFINVLDDEDPFGASVRDFVMGLGIGIDSAAQTRLCVGPGRSGNWPATNCIAMGDAAYRLLQHSGFDVLAVLPLNGRLTVNRSRAGSPPQLPQEFVTVQYAQFEVLNGAAPPGWTVWTEDENGQASTWVHAEKKLACLLFRPDSLMSDAGAQKVFLEALVVVSQ